MRRISGLVVLGLLATNACGDGGSGTPANSAHAGGSGGAGAGAGPGAGAGGAGEAPGAGASAGGSTQKPPAVVVADCSGLKKTGAWEEITPPQINMADGYYPSSPAVDPVNAGTMYVGMGRNTGKQPLSLGVLKTTDCGATWTKVNTGRNGPALDLGNQWTFVVDPITPQTIYTNSGYGSLGLYKSVNGGVDWDQIWPTTDQSLTAQAAGFVGNLQMDPDDHQHLLMTFHDVCGKQEDQIGCFGESKDGGSSWQLIHGTPSFEPQVRAYFLENSSTWLSPSKGSLWRTTDSGKTWANVGQLPAGGHSAGVLYRAKTGAFYVGTEYGIVRSDDGITWTAASNTGDWVSGISGSGTTLFASAAHTMVMSPEADGKAWTDLTPALVRDLGGPTGYDVSHKVLYATYDSDPGGMFRMVTE